MTVRFQVEYRSSLKVLELKTEVLALKVLLNVGILGHPWAGETR